ncbi:glucosidase family protein [Pedobacter arcticus]|uniref:hypothetical protein n=1 Tax=Pedobacter arcticus TaxID=752140 RepID=UPI0002E345DB|nr:hypothetical protein [Pedobacter arcticus]
MSIKKSSCLIIFYFLILTANAQLLSGQNNRWHIQNDGSSIRWDINGKIPHEDHIEMSGEKVSLWVKYGLDSVGRSSVNRTLVFPTFRVLPVSTRSHISYFFSDNDLPRFYINNRLLQLDLSKGRKTGNLPYVVKSITQGGIMRIYAEGGTPTLAKIERSFFPSVNRPLALENFTFTNVTHEAITVSMEYLKKEIRTNPERSTPVAHSVMMASFEDGTRTLEPGATTTFSVYYLASNTLQKETPIHPQQEEQKREERVNAILNLLQLETPETVLNTAFNFAKIRATESIFKTKGGYMHAPGGLSYYAAVWANDQAEYINPFFGFLGDSIANLSAMNTYRLFAEYMNPEYKPLPSSIIAEGISTWQGAKDRGDAAMIAYGASRYALTFGNIDSARKLWPLIKWCLHYNQTKMNNAGVVASDSDELEGRFPSGKANLSTNSLYYDALVSSAMLAQNLDEPFAAVKLYQQQAAALKKNIEKYFGGNVQGFDTYKYYEDNDVLRAWICLPLTMGILDRKDATIAALFSPKLWTADGLATEAGKETFWDRSTLYALRGVLQAGETEKAMAYLKYYSNRRLLGEHVPYPVEAYPEGNQRHLSAESGLYCRIYTEGLFGMRPTGFSSFDCTPRLPKNWSQMSLKNIHSFGRVFSLTVNRVSADKLKISVQQNGESFKEYMIEEGVTKQIIL